MREKEQKIKCRHRNKIKKVNKDKKIFKNLLRLKNKIFEYVKQNKKMFLV